MTQNQKIISGSIVVIILAFFAFKSKEAPPSQALPTTSAAQEEPAPAMAPVVPVAAVSATVNPGVPSPALESETPAIGVKTKEQIQAARTSADLVQRFEQHAKIEIPKQFKEMIFEKIPAPGGGAVGLIGKTPSDLSLAIIYKEGSGDARELRDYINDDVAESLKMEISPDTLDKGVTTTPPKNSGFSAVTVWITTDKDKTAVISYAKRADGKGGYLSVFSGDSADLRKNEDRYDEGLQDFHAK